MPSLFEKTSIKSLSMPNRFIRSATWMSMAAADGSCTPRLVETTENLAAGGIGLIIAGFSFVSPEGKGPVGMTGMHSNHLVAGFRGLVDRVHGLGTPIAAQLAHCGIQSAPLSADGEVLGPSDIARDAGRTARGGGRLKARGLEAFEIDRIVEDFAAATVRAKEIGFDAVQLHFAHGYLGSQFLSPYYNQRDDEYGGSIENRIRFLLEVSEARPIERQEAESKAMRWFPAEGIEVRFDEESLARSTSSDRISRAGCAPLGPANTRS